MKISLKEFIKKEWPLLLLILAQFMVGLCSAPYLPDKVPIHWNVYGQVDNYGSKMWGVVWFPLISLALYAMFFLLPLIDPKRKNYDLFEGSYKVIRSTILLFFAAIYGFTIAYSLGYTMRVDKVIPVAVAVLFIILGNYFGRIKQNWFVGIKTPWTISDSEVWNKTHRVSGKIWVIGGLIMAAASLLLEGPMLFVIFMGAILILAFGPIIYSYVLYRKLHKNE